MKLRRTLFKMVSYKIVPAGTCISKEGTMPSDLNIVWTGKVILQREIFHKFDSRIMTTGVVKDGESVLKWSF